MALIALQFFVTHVCSGVRPSHRVPHTPLGGLLLQGPHARAASLLLYDGLLVCGLPVILHGFGSLLFWVENGDWVQASSTYEDLGLHDLATRQLIRSLFLDSLGWLSGGPRGCRAESR